MAIRTSCFLPYDEGWTPPTTGELSQVSKALKMTAPDIAAFTGLKDARTARNWCAGTGTSTIPYAAWRLLVEALDRLKKGGNVRVDISGLSYEPVRPSETMNTVLRLGAGWQRFPGEIDQFQLASCVHLLLHDTRKVGKSFAKRYISAFQDEHYAYEFLTALINEATDELQKKRILQLKELVNVWD